MTTETTNDLPARLTARASILHDLFDIESAKLLREAARVLGLLQAAAKLGTAVRGLEVSYRGRMVSLRADGCKLGRPWVAVIDLDDDEDIVCEDGATMEDALDAAADSADDLLGPPSVAAPK